MAGSGPPPYRVLVADDHPIVRCGLRTIIEAADGLQVAAEAATAEDVLRHAEQTPCDLIVLDLSMPGATGLSTLKTLRARFPHLPVLVLSVMPEDQLALTALKSGAAGYLPKRSAPGLLVQAIRHIVGGGIHLSAAMHRALVTQAQGPGPLGSARRGLITPRELEVLRHLASGLSTTATASELGVSVKTVSTHRTRLLRKLYLPSTAALIRYALQERLVEP